MAHREGCLASADLVGECGADAVPSVHLLPLRTASNTDRGRTALPRDPVTHRKTSPELGLAVPIPPVSGAGAAPSTNPCGPAVTNLPDGAP